MSKHEEKVNLHGYIVSEFNGKLDMLFKEEDYSMLKNCETLEEISIKLMKNYKTITDDMALSKYEFRKRLNKSLMQEYDRCKNDDDEYLTHLLDYYMDKHRINNFFFLLQSKLQDPELDSSFKKIEIGDFDALRTLKFSKDMNDVQRFCVENCFLKKYYYKVKWENDFKDNNFQIAHVLFLKYHIEETYHKILKSNLFMLEILSTEADRYIIDLTINTIESKDLVGNKRKNLFPVIHALDDKTVDLLATADSFESINSIISAKFEIEGDMSEFLIKRKIAKYFESFKEFNDISCVYSYFRLKEQEIKNILWIVECISQDRREEMDNVLLKTH